MQKVLLEMHRAIQLKAEIKRTMEMVSKRLHVTAAWVEEKVNLQKVKHAQYFFFQISNRNCANLMFFFYFVATVKRGLAATSIIYNTVN